ncbi:acyl-CoA dehydrogenase family protein [Streptomyces sp. NPDC050625]|uniref:acyl-CoA dehydrogenase family protein n=1 Tax=Streptomyces sp. NPDC050625 TaxID=3154629 RepID=UPI00342104F1
MTIELSPEQKDLQRTVRELVKNKIDPMLDNLPEEPLPTDVLREVLRMLEPFGVLNARVPEEDGGSGLGYVNLGLIYEQLPPEISMDIASNDMIAMRLCMGGSDALKQKYLPGLASGELMAGSCISEPGAGSDVTSMATKAVKVDGGYRITGQKVWSSHAAVADVVLVAASVGTDERGRSIVGRFILDTRETDGYEARDLNMMGLKRHHLGEVTLDNAFVPDENLCGEPGDGVAALTRSWLGARAMLAIMSVHLMQRALEASIEYVKTREQFGKPIGAFQLVQKAIVEMQTLTDTSRYLAYRTLKMLDDGEFPRLESSQAKYYATEAAVKVTNMAIELHGAMGLSCELPLEKWARDARMLWVPDGTGYIQRLMAGREILGLNAIR